MMAQCSRFHAPFHAVYFWDSYKKKYIRLAVQSVDSMPGLPVN